MNCIKRIWVLMLILFLILPAAMSGEDTLVTEAYTLIPEADQRMRYDCVSFRDAWPDPIRDEMTALFGEERVIEGIYYVWQALIGDSMPIVFAACESGGRKTLVGAWYHGDIWTAQIISDRFFRPDRSFDIVMKPFYNAEGCVTYYLPAVRYDGEWFAFQPTVSGFLFSCYEREEDWAEDSPDGQHMVVEILDTLANGNNEKWFVISVSEIGDYKRELWRGRILDSFDTDMIDAAAFPATFGEVQALCEPNG